MVGVLDKVGETNVGSIIGGRLRQGGAGNGGAPTVEKGREGAERLG
jgi:hypothetical protein